MKSLCITGTPSAQLTVISESLYQAGLVPAKSLQDGDKLDVHSWHQRVVPMLMAGQPMGRLWEKIAEDLLLANLSDDPWGWHADESLWALDFWASLEPSIHFLLVCQSPEAYLAKAMLNTETSMDVGAILEQWRVEHALMLEFYLNHPERCLLVDSNQAVLSPQALIESVNEQWQLFDSPPNVQANDEYAVASPPMHLAMTLARSWGIRESDSVQGLCQELEAAQYPLVPISMVPHESSLDESQVTDTLQMFQRILQDTSHYQMQERALEEAKDEIHRLSTRAAEEAQEKSTQNAAREKLAAQLSSLEHELSTSHQEKEALQAELQRVRAQLDQASNTLQHESELLLRSLHTTQDQLERELATSHQEKAALQSELQQVREQFDQSNTALHQESEALLLSLHTTQGQLEHEVATSQKEKTALQTELQQVREQLDQKNAALQQESEALLLSLHTTQDQLERELATSQQEKTTLQAELQQVREQLDQANTALQQESEALLRSLHAAQDRLEQSLAKRQSEHTKHVSECNALQQTLNQVQQEANRLAEVDRENSHLRQECASLLQILHTTQERLEQSHAKHRAEHEKSASERDLFQKELVESRQEIARLSELVDHNDTLRQQALKESHHLRQECEKLLVDLQQSQASLESQVQHSNGQQSSLSALQQRLIALKQRAGPGMAADSTSVTHPHSRQVEWAFHNVLIGEQEHDRLTITGKLIRGNLSLEIMGNNDTSWGIDATRQVTLNTLSPAQHKLTQGLPEILRAHLPLAFESPRQIRTWQRAIGKLEQQLATQPLRLWMETAELRHIQVNPDYEHLWVILRQASFDGSEPVDWQFRLSSANVTPQSFGSQPKLELPHLQQQLLKNWFQESEDVYGEKLELRFALPNAMDTGIWKRLSTHDQQLIQSLIQQLPEILSQLEQQGQHPGREWSEWHQLAHDMQRILRAKAS